MRTNYIKKTLSNGVKLYLYLDKTMKKYYVDYGVDYGSSGKWHKFYLDDELYEVLPGCAHFLEHMLGEHSKYGNFYTYISGKKYQINAGTFFNVTHFYFQGTEDIYDCIEKLINMVDDPVFNDDDIAQSKHAIAEETKRVLNNKKRMGSSILAHNIYKDLNLFDKTYSTIGNEETTDKLDYKTLKACYDAFYYDENKTLVIAGNFDEDEITNFLEGVYSKLPKHQKRLKEYTYKELDKIKTEEQIHYMPTKEDFLSIGFKEKNTSFTRKEIFYLLSFLFEGKLTDDKEFIKKLKKDDIISSMDAYDFEFADDKNYYIELNANVKDANKFKEIILKELNKNDFKESDWNLYIREKIATQVYRSDRKYQEINRLFPRKHYSDDFDDLEFLKTLTFERFLEFYQSLNFDNYSVSIIRDKDKANN